MFRAQGFCFVATPLPQNLQVTLRKVGCQMEKPTQGAKIGISLLSNIRNPWAVRPP
jgi:hypothetical protein